MTDSENGSGECLRVAGPYLKSGESIILTTDRVLIDDVEYDLILTSQRLALVDSDHTIDQPQVVPFATILSVKGGTTPAREPFITLTVIDPVGLEDSKTIDLIFSQQPYEDRAAECDRWVQKLIENIVSVRQEPATTAKQQVPSKPRGMNPTVRRFGAPEVPLPHSQVAGKSRRPSEELLSAIQGTDWDTPDETVENPAPKGKNNPRELVQPAPEHETGHAQPAPSDSREETASSPVPEEPVDRVKAESPQKNADGDRPIVSAEEDSAVPVQEEEQVSPAAPATPFDELVPQVPEMEPEPSAGEGPDGKEPVLPVNTAEFREPAKKPGIPALVLPELLLHLKNLPEPEIPDLSDLEEHEEESAGKPAELPVNRGTGGTAPDHNDESGTPETGTGKQTGLPDTVIFPVLSDASSGDGPKTPPVITLPTVPSPAPQHPVPQPGKIPVRMIGAIIIVILVIIAGALVMYLVPAEMNGGSDHPVVTPVNQTPAPVMTTTAPVMVPADGVWVKVTYNGTFLGTYGNPGSLTEVRGTGEKFYPIKNSNDLVQASFTKQDYYGDVLTVGVYNNGTMVRQFTTSAPKGTISILVDPKTGKAPYVPVTTIGS